MDTVVMGGAADGCLVGEIGGRRRRRTFSDEQTRRMVAECDEPGASVSLVARRHDANANLLFTWRRQLAPEGSPTQTLDLIPMTLDLIPIGVVEAPPRACAFDVVVVEALDRLSRSQGDTATLFEDLRLRCSLNRERGTGACANGRGVKCEAVETHVVEAMKGLLLQPEVIEEALREFQTLTTKRSAQAQIDHAKLEAEFAEVKRRAGRLIDQVADGVPTGAAVKERLAALEASRADLEARPARS